MNYQKINIAPESGSTTCFHCGGTFRIDHLTEWEPGEFTCVHCEHAAATREQQAELVAA